jgi:hypothetical protein
MPLEFAGHSSREALRRKDQKESDTVSIQNDEVESGRRLLSG